MENTKWEEMSDFEKFFYGSSAYADGDLDKDCHGNYTMPITQAFFECWNVAKGIT